MQFNAQNLPPYNLFVIVMLFGAGSNQAQSLALNEIMSSNAVTLADDDGDYEDWIEFYNYGNEPISLEGFGLSDDFANPYRWVFPDVMIQPGEFMLVWASGKDRRNPGAALHTNFSLSASGEEIILTNAVGLMVDTLSPTSLNSDVSYGRVPDGQGVWRFLLNLPPTKPIRVQAMASCWALLTFRIVRVLLLKPFAQPQPHRPMPKSFTASMVLNLTPQLLFLRKQSPFATVQTNPMIFRRFPPIFWMLGLPILKAGKCHWDRCLK